jgi:hypothetical protein
MRETRDLQDNQLTNPKTQTPSKKKKQNKTRRKRKFQLKTHWNAQYLEEMKTIWRKLPTLKFNPPNKKNKMEGKKIPSQNT